MTGSFYGPHSVVEPSDSEKRIADLESRLSAIQAVVDEQAEDDGLWFHAQYITEDHLQRELRRLHRVIERAALSLRSETECEK